MKQQMGTRMHVTVPDALKLTRVDGWRLLSLMAHGSIDWAYGADGVVLISVESLSTVAERSIVRSRILENAVAA